MSDTTLIQRLLAFFKRLLCKHKRGFLLAIEYDGASLFECADCGKHVRKPL